MTKDSTYALDLLTTRRTKEAYLDVMSSDPALFDHMLEIAITNHEDAGWRAAWLIGHCMDKDDVRVKPRIDRILQSAKTASEGHLRQLLIILQNLTLDDDSEGLLFDLCANIWESTQHAPALRINALKCIVKTVSNYPELINECEVLFQEEYIAALSPGIRRSARRMIDSLQKIQ